MRYMAWQHARVIDMNGTRHRVCLALTEPCLLLLCF